MNYFNEIYQLAKQGDEVALKNLLPDICIDESKQGNIYITAAFQLAAENNQEAVNLLMKFEANIVPIARGAAMGGHFTYVDELLKKGAHIDDVAFGAAWGGHFTYVKELLDKGANIYSAIRGFVMGSDLTRAEELHNEAKKKWNSLPVDAEIQLAVDAAMCGYFDYAEKNIKSVDKCYFAQGAAIGGYRDYAEKHRNSYSLNIEIAKAAAMGGYREHAEEIFSGNPYCIHAIAYGAARGGHRADAEEFRKQGAGILTIADGAKEGGHRVYEYFLRCYFKAAASLPDARTAPAVKLNTSLNVNPNLQVKTATSQSTATPLNNQLKDIAIINLMQQIRQLETRNNNLQQWVNSQDTLIVSQQQTISGLNEVVEKLKKENTEQQQLLDLQQRNLLHQTQQMLTPFVISAHSSAPTTITSAFFQPAALTLSQGSLSANSDSSISQKKNENESPSEDRNFVLSVAVKRELEDQSPATLVAKRPRNNG